MLGAFLALLFTAGSIGIMVVAMKRAVVKIGVLHTNASFYDGKLVRIKGIFWGWTYPTTIPETRFYWTGGSRITRSDWIVEDDTGWIYITGKAPPLDLFEDVGEPIEVRGIAHIKYDGKAYIDARGEGKEFIRAESTTHTIPDNI